MKQLPSCPHCNAFLPPSADVCVQCKQADAGVPGWLRPIGVVLGGAAVSITLMACYGPPPRRIPDATSPPTSNTGSTPMATDPDAGK
ncbi:MAG: hypothetical protein HOO96_00035 [Polyangiaceae bacterium]|nr:hypothetical protein [Polyangiaceae bacterium]